MGKVEHPLIAQATHAFEELGRTFLVMEYIDGWNLTQVVSRVGPLDFIDALCLIRQIALGMDFAHLRGFIHGDIKPSNIMLSREGELKILDLGLVKSMSVDSVLVIRELREAIERADVSDSVTSKVASPADSLSEAALEVRADIHAIGLTLFRLLTGRRPVHPAPISLKQTLACQAELKQYRPTTPFEILSLYSELRSLSANRRLINMLGVIQAIDAIRRRLSAPAPIDVSESSSEIVRGLALFHQRINASLATMPRLLGRRGERSELPSAGANGPQRATRHRRSQLACWAPWGIVMLGLLGLQTFGAWLEQPPAPELASQNNSELQALPDLPDVSNLPLAPENHTRCQRRCSGWCPSR